MAVIFSSLLTEHGLQANQTGDEVVKVDRHVGLRVPQDDQLEQVVGQLEACLPHTHTHANDRIDLFIKKYVFFLLTIRSDVSTVETV